jgi:hypothetical protein
MTKMTRPFLVLLAAALAPAALAQSAPNGAPANPGNATMHVDGAAAATLDWGALVGASARVVYLGDVPASVAIKRALSGAMPALEHAGAGVLAVEMLRAGDQALLDQYGSDPDVRGRVGALIGNAWGAPAEEYLKLLDAAHAAQLELRALSPDPKPGEADAPYAAVGPAAKSARDARMAATLAALSRRPGGGVVLAFVGADRARRGAQPARLRDDGVASRSYAFAEPSDPAVARLSVAGLDAGTWLLPGDDDFDGLIYVPAVERESSAR